MTDSCARIRAATLGTLCLLAAATATAAEREYGTAVPPGARAGDLSMAPCEVHLDGDDKSYPGDCGTLVVPENRRNPASRLIALPVTRVRATGAAPLEPIFWFQGGPGNPNSMDYPTDGLLARHDLVIVGYRGADGQVTLPCPEIGDAIREAYGAALGERALASYGQAGAACVTRLRAAGIDLDGYSMLQTIDDNEAARTALGYERINLYGNSYGTRVELLYQWRHPDSIRRVVLVSVNPPGHFVWEPARVEAQLGQYAALCAQDAYCSSRTPDLLATLREVSRDMPASWLGIPIDTGAVRLMSFFGLMESITPPGMPLPASGPAVIDAWLDAAEGDASGMALMSVLGRFLMPWMGSRGHGLAMGMSSPDLLPYLKNDYKARLMPPGAILGSPMSAFLQAIAFGWPVSPDMSTGEVPASAVETLLVSGNIDFSTPLEAARDELLPQLSNGHQVVLRDFGHTETIWNSQPEARARLLNTWFDTGVVDPSLYRHQPVSFNVERSWSGVAKTLLGLTVLVTGALLLLAFVLVRKLCRRLGARPAGAGQP
jgi:pimeloyl-ACP methyl ester carboxylesterase